MNKQPGVRGTSPDPITCSQTLRVRSRPTPNSLAEPEHCSCRRAGWPSSSDAGTLRSPGRRWMVGRPCCHWNASSGSGYQERRERQEPVSDLQDSHPVPCPQATSRPCPRPSHCPLISRRVPAAWWASPVSDVSCGFGVSGPVHRLRGRSRSGQPSSSWYTPGHRAPLWSTQGWEPGSPQKCSHPTASAHSLSSQAVSMPQSPVRRHRSGRQAPEPQEQRTRCSREPTHPTKRQGWGRPQGPSGEPPSHSIY